VVRGREVAIEGSVDWCGRPGEDRGQRMGGARWAAVAVVVLVASTVCVLPQSAKALKAVQVGVGEGAAVDADFERVVDKAVEDWKAKEDAKSKRAQESKAHRKGDDERRTAPAATKASATESSKTGDSEDLAWDDWAEWGEKAGHAFARRDRKLKTNLGARLQGQPKTNVAGVGIGGSNTMFFAEAKPDLFRDKYEMEQQATQFSVMLRAAHFNDVKLFVLDTKTWIVTVRLAAENTAVIKFLLETGKVSKVTLDNVDYTPGMFASDDSSDDEFDEL